MQKRNTEMLTLNSLMAATRHAGVYGLGKHVFGHGFEPAPKTADRPAEEPTDADTPEEQDP